MRTHNQPRYTIPLLLGLSAAVVMLGAGICILAETSVFWVVAVVPATIVAVVVAASAGPAALAKAQNLAAGCRWWHWLWCLVFLSGLVFRDRNIDTLREAPIDFWAGWRIGLMGLVAAVLLSRLASRRSDWGIALLRGLPAGVFLCGVVSLISTLWSIYPMWTLYKSVEYLVDVALLAAVVRAVRNLEEIKSLFDITWLLTGLLLITVWLGILFRPDLAVATGVGLIGIAIQGVLPSISSNGVGDLAAILLVIAATRLLFRNHHRNFYWLVCLAALPTLVFAQSRSPATAALLGLLAVFLLARRFGLLAFVGLSGAALVLLTSAEAVVRQAFLRGQDTDLFYSLSGRIGWWIPAWETFRENPFLGLGGYAAGRFGVLDQLGVTQTSSLHNAWLEILVGVGLIGFLPFLATFVGTWLTLLRTPDTRCATPTETELRIETIGLFVMLCFRSIFTAEFIWHPPLLFFLVLGYAELLRKCWFGSTPACQSVPAAWKRGRGVRFRGAFGVRGGQVVR
jgi:O-antigen ligase